MLRSGPGVANAFAGGDGDGLQADVMRFLAIIAICLLAVLALVRGTPTAVPQTASPAPAVSGAVAPASAPAVAPTSGAKAATPTPATPIAGAAPDTPEPLRPEAAAPRRSAIEAAALRRSRAQAATPTPTPVDASAAPGLGLRFASEAAFLSLVSTGRVRVFAWHGGEVLALLPSLRFEAGALPAQLHEILPATLPARVAALFTARAEQPARAASWRWGVALPDATGRAISAWLERVEHGELLIDAKGEVTHVDP